MDREQRALRTREIVPPRETKKTSFLTCFIGNLSVSFPCSRETSQAMMSEERRLNSQANGNKHSTLDLF